MASPAEAPALHLRGESADDLPALSALLQDMALRAGDVSYDARRRRLSLVGNRYRHEDPARPSRVRCGVTVAFADSARRRNWPADPDTVLALLSVTPDAAEDAPDDSAVLLSFAGGVSLRLSTECIDVTVDDLSGPWGASGRPDHR